ncbi:MAG: hypothetical protein ACK4K7_06400 [Allosphingosinicella sp.]|uniref:hypothetical protein n=1 Tax=Allosphingosinicella sp. TaxID=2823234 RepID=UPI00395F76DD
MGPLTFEARLMGLERVLGMQRQVNELADALGRPGIVLIDAEEEARIREPIALKTCRTGGPATRRTPTSGSTASTTTAPSNPSSSATWWEADHDRAPPEEAAQRLRISTKTLRRLRQEGRIRYAHAFGDDVRKALEASEPRTIPEAFKSSRRKA